MTTTITADKLGKKLAVHAENLPDLGRMFSKNLPTSCRSGLLWGILQIFKVSLQVSALLAQRKSCPWTQPTNKKGFGSLKLGLMDL
jgi:hypothetical protein